MNIDAHTRTVWLLGRPVSHSLSPVIHNAVYASMGVNLVYVAASLEDEQLESALAGLSALGFAGANVTVPHKQTVIPLLDELDQAAAALGAVNAIVPRDGKLWGYNTDAQGWLDSWDESVGLSLAGRPAVLVGAGGAARAIFWALQQRGVTEFSLLNRTVSRAQELGDSMAGPAVKWKALSLTSFAEELQQNSVVVQCTSASLQGAAAAEWPAELPSGVVACDLVYRPLVTNFLSQAQQRGATILGGLGMLLHQAARAIELWTARAPDVELMHAAVQAALARAEA